MDFFNTLFNCACPSFPFVPKGLRDSKGYPIVSFNTLFSPACLSVLFVPKLLMDSKRYRLDSFNIVFNMSVHPFPLS